MFQLVQLFLCFLSFVLAAPEDAFIDPNSRFIKVGPGQWQNASVNIHSSHFYGDESLLVHLLLVYGTDAFDEFRNITGSKMAISVLGLDERATYVLQEYYNVSASEVPIGSLENMATPQVPLSTRGLGSPLTWMRYLQEFFWNSTGQSVITPLIQEMDEIPDVYQKIWSRVENDDLRGFSRDIGIGGTLKHVPNGRTQYITVNSDLQAFDNSAKSSTFLFAVRSNKKRCLALSNEEELNEAADCMIQKAFERKMIAFEISLAGGARWLGCDWLGKFSVLPSLELES